VHSIYQRLDIISVFRAVCTTFYNDKKGPSTMSSKPSRDNAIDVEVQIVQFMVVRCWWNSPHIFSLLFLKYKLCQSKFRVVLLFIFSFNCGLLSFVWSIFVFDTFVFLVLSISIWFYLIFILNTILIRLNIVFFILFLIFFKFCLSTFYFTYFFIWLWSSLF